MKRSESKIKKVPQKLKDFASLISAMIVIGGALAGAGQWIVHEVNASTNTRMDAIEKKIDDHQRSTELSVTRLELMTLIKTSPENVTEIERVGRYYFLTLEGDWYLSSLYSDWCAKYGGDASIVIK